jgi:hypothetical protein
MSMQQLGQSVMLWFCFLQEDASHIFVAIVPVVLDSIFKYW